MLRGVIGDKRVRTSFWDFVRSAGRRPRKARESGAETASACWSELSPLTRSARLVGSPAILSGQDDVFPD
jgi:hypothetical protein